MEARKITIVQTKTQRKSVIMSSATTLGELKNDLSANGIDYRDMTFFEGLSKVELKNDSSVLPHDIPYRGEITNELVFMLTNTNKKIRSGAMTRLEAYNTIKAKGLQEACVKKFGKNFTMCKTVDLISLIEGASKKETPTPVITKTPVEVPTKTEEVKEIKKDVTPEEVVDKVARAAIAKLAEALYDNDAIDYGDKEEIIEMLNGEFSPKDMSKESKVSSPYSDSEIDNMFEGMGI